MDKIGATRTVPGIPFSWVELYYAKGGRGVEEIEETRFDRGLDSSLDLPSSLPGEGIL